MPVEIRELVIKAEVKPGNEPGLPPDSRTLERLKQEIIREAVDQVLTIIHNKNER